MKIVDWYRGLDKDAKIGLVAASLMVVGIGSIASASSSTSNQQPESTTPVVEAKDEITTKTVTETEVVKYSSTTVDDSSIAKGETVVRVAGTDGVRTITYKITFTNGAQTNKSVVSEEITTKPVNAVIAKGTYVAPVVQATPAPVQRSNGNCDPNYTPCVPKVSYDLDCPDIGFSVRVIGSDPHRFDREGDGYGCESY